MNKQARFSSLADIIFNFDNISTVVVLSPFVLATLSVGDILILRLSCMCADIAVGAPFDGDGKVFIYRGSEAGIETKPAQVS